MNNEEFERKAAFIVEQQAQFAADIQQLQAVQAQTDSVVGRLANLTFAGFNHMLAGFDDVKVKFEALVDSQIRTDGTLRNLIAVVDRYFSEGRNGQ
jgi:hypothetical protein